MFVVAFVPTVMELPLKTKAPAPASNVSEVIELLVTARLVVPAKMRLSPVAAGATSPTQLAAVPVFPLAPPPSDVKLAAIEAPAHHKLRMLKSRKPDPADLRRY